MSDGLLVTERSLLASFERMNTLSNNVANANTTAYKSEESFLQIIERLENLDADPPISKSIDFGNGAIQQTGRPLDLALFGDGFFVLELNGENYFSRDGQFKLNALGEIVNNQGYALLGSSGSIRIDGDVSVHADGGIWADGQQIDKIQITNVSTSALEAIGGGLFRAGALATVTEVETPTVLQGAVEASNVDAQKEMIELVKVMRSIETQQRLIKAYEQIMDAGITTIGEF